VEDLLTRPAHGNDEGICAVQRLPVDGEAPLSALGENQGRQLIEPRTAWLLVPPARHFPEGFGDGDHRRVRGCRR
jgi:hypothetical protein